MLVYRWEKIAEETIAWIEGKLSFPHYTTYSSVLLRKSTYSPMFEMQFYFFTIHPNVPCNFKCIYITLCEYFVKHKKRISYNLQSLVVVHRIRQKLFLSSVLVSKKLHIFTFSKLPVRRHRSFKKYKNCLPTW